MARTLPLMRRYLPPQAATHDHGDGTHLVRFRPEHSGPHQVHAWLIGGGGGGAALGGSPYALHVSGGPAAAATSEVIGVGEARRVVAVAGREGKLRIQLRDALGNDCTTEGATLASLVSFLEAAPAGYHPLEAASADYHPVPAAPAGYHPTDYHPVTGYHSVDAYHPVALAASPRQPAEPPRAIAARALHAAAESAAAALAAIPATTRRAARPGPEWEVYPESAVEVTLLEGSQMQLAYRLAHPGRWLLHVALRRRDMRGGDGGDEPLRCAIYVLGG